MTKIKTPVKRKEVLPKAPNEQLRALVERWTSDTFKRQHILRAIDHAVAWYVQEKLSDGEVDRRAQRLAKAASKFGTELERSEPFLRFMAHWAPSGQSVMPPDQADGPWFADLKARVIVAKTAAEKVAKVSHKTKRTPEQFEQTLAEGLGSIFKDLTGKPPGFSNSGDNDKPNSVFGKFVRLALLTSPHSDDEKVQRLLAKLSSFVGRVSPKRSKLPRV